MEYENVIKKCTSIAQQNVYLLKNMSYIRLLINFTIVGQRSFTTNWIFSKKQLIKTQKKFFWHIWF